MQFSRSKRWTIALLALLLLGSALVFTLRKTSRSSKALSQMSPEERYCLGVFLRGILFSDDFSYLVFGSKPIAVANFEKKFNSFRFSRHLMSESNFKTIKGLEVFKKYQYTQVISKIGFFSHPITTM